MELTLNVYKCGKVEKMYTAEDFVLTTGTCEDILDLAEKTKLLEMIGKPDVDELALGMEGMRTLRQAFPKLKPMLMEVFEGLTEDEIKRTSIKEVGQVVVQIIKFTIGEISEIGAKKN